MSALSIKKILFPVDFSAASRGTARYVEAMAGRFEANVRLIHVVGMGEHSLPSELIPHKQEELNRFGAGDLRFFSEDRQCIPGDDPAYVIERAAIEWGADLIMMPTHGTGVFRRLLLGSVTSKVLHDVPCPVWTSVHAEAAPDLEAIHCRRILCAVDLSARSTAVLAWAAAMAEKFGASLAIAHATGEIPLFWGDDNMRKAYLEATDRQAVEHIAGLQKSISQEADISIRQGSPAEVVGSVAKEFGADLIIIGRHSGEEPRGFLRSTAVSILRSSPCPVISI